MMRKIILLLIMFTLFFIFGCNEKTPDFPDNPDDNINENEGDNGDENEEEDKCGNETENENENEDNIGTLTVEYDYTIYLGEYGKLSVVSTYKNDEIKIVSMNKSVIQIDSTKSDDKITLGVGIGVAGIMITNKYGEYKTIYIEVKEEKNVVNIESISLNIVEEGPYYLEEVYHIEYDITPSDAYDDVRFVYETSDLTINLETLEIVFKKAGTSSLKCYSTNDFNVQDNITFEVDFNPNIEMYDLLFIGNSMTQFQYSIPTIISNMITADGVKVNISMDSISPQWLADHETSFNILIAQRKYTHVILQEYSQGPVANYEKFETYALKYTKKIEENGAQLVFYQTWTYNQDSILGLTKDEFAAALIEAYDNVAYQTGATVSRVGEAFQLYESLAAVDAPTLYYDSHHPSVYGAYLSACVHYATLTGKQASLNSYVMPEIEEDVTEYIKFIADQIVFG